VRWYSVAEAASAAEWSSARMMEAVQFGEVPAVRLRSGEVVVLASAVRGIDWRLSEH
jgi:hypothetical protein